MCKLLLFFSVKWGFVSPMKIYFCCNKLCLSLAFEVTLFISSVSGRLGSYMFVSFVSSRIVGDWGVVSYAFDFRVVNVSGWVWFRRKSICVVS